MLSSARDALLALVFPSFCQVCGTLVESWVDGVACAACWAESGWSAGTSLCQKCGLANPSPTSRTCGSCGPLLFREARSCGPYAGAWRESVLWLKAHPQVAPRIVDALRSCCLELATAHQIDSLLPIPLHPARQRARGFNQAGVIAGQLARATRLPLDCASLVRIAPTTRHRAGMDAAQRARSLKRAFRVRAARGVTDRGILVIDDLMTTAATANEVASVLLEAGAREVCILTIARVISAPLWGKRLALV